MALHQFREPAFAQSKTRFGGSTWHFDTVLAQSVAMVGGDLRELADNTLAATARLMYG